MGYYTRYAGTVSGPDVLLEQFREAAENDETFGDYDIPLSDFFSTYGFLDGETIKWYGWEDDTLELSKRFPGLLITIEGEGEESGDVWKAFLRNGKCVTVQGRIVFEEPDLDKELPAPDVEEIARELKARKTRELEEEIARLNVERARLLAERDGLED